MNGILLFIAGAKGAIGSCLAFSSVLMSKGITLDKYLLTEFPQRLVVTGWDLPGREIFNRLIDDELITDYRLIRENEEELKKLFFFDAPPQKYFSERIDAVSLDMKKMLNLYPDLHPVLAILMPASSREVPDISVNQLRDQEGLPEDLCYYLAAIENDIPIINFTPNELETKNLIEEAKRKGVPIAGRDGKTGQTYFKVVLASAFKARSLKVNGWYSTNILGNNDGLTLSNPNNARRKIINKSRVLEDALGYKPGSHIVKIDYYQPRKDAKEAWDVIDISGIFEEKMSLRVNFQGKDSILATPIIMDVAHLIACAHHMGENGPIDDLNFFFKMSIGKGKYKTYETQLEALTKYVKKVC